ncbi:MAG: large conductance mechanosensitive channel protein MscL [Lachnospiraceae bacterium]|nr:large conductance mechanosensitive channel protein MscL [Lachnospiraceae bacterium]MBR3035851.1 large conductance mechanosensitive channel protein MscL [Lachnospiraceae bacterium]
MKKFWKEFKEFAVKGNMIDLAVGVIIGGAFTGLVNGFMTNIVNPLIGLLTGGVDLDNLWKIPVGPVLEDGTQATVNIGAFISVIINFLILALVIFLIVKAVNKVRAAEQKRKEAKEGKKEEAPTTKICPFCKTEIPIDATRCPHCTSDLTE